MQVKRGTGREAAIVACRLDKDIRVRTLAPNPAFARAIQRGAAREAKIVRPNANTRQHSVERPNRFQIGLFEEFLGRGGDIRIDGFGDPRGIA